MAKQLGALGVLMLLVMLTACASGNGSAGDQVPPVSAGVSEDVTGQLVVTSIQQVCRDRCVGSLHVRDHFIVNQSEEGALVPEAVRDVLGESLGPVAFIDSRTELELATGDADTSVVHVGPVTPLDATVVGVDIGVLTSSDGAHYETVQFTWTGDDWRLATSDETGVTVTTSSS